MSSSTRLRPTPGAMMGFRRKNDTAQPCPSGRPDTTLMAFSRSSTQVSIHTAQNQALVPQELNMPFARIDLIQGKSADYRCTIGDVVYEAIVDVLNAPLNDRFQVISEHPPENHIAD